MPGAARTPEERATEEVEVELSHDEAAAGRARNEVREAFTRWGLTVLVDDAVLAVSELVTNAVKHGHPPVLLRLSQCDGRVRIDVSDTRPETVSREWPVASNDCESGRGLGIVEAVSDDSGIESTSDRGKSAYVSWDVDPHAPSGR
ncbi:MAG TPA: ATP-binding protein [Mycobacteriales bacterium]|nr:ATP-binding protein [Mycobacteriales bacterium]